MQAHDDPVSGPSVNPPKFDIPDQAIREASNFLERKIDLDDPDDVILDQLFFFVHRALSQYPELSGVIANREDYDANVKRQGEEQFLELVRDSARRNSWRDLFHNGISPPLTTSPFFILSVQTCL
jgi:hypothetical protein